MGSSSKRGNPLATTASQDKENKDKKLTEEDQDLAESKNIQLLDDVSPTDVFLQIYDTNSKDNACSITLDTRDKYRLSNHPSTASDPHDNYRLTNKPSTATDYEGSALKSIVKVDTMEDSV